MNRVISGYEPSALFQYFEDICAIPHASANEGGIADYLEAFARSHGLDCKRDALHNVIIKKPASPGCEDAPTLILQAHTDMVCVKTPGSSHDFSRDGLRLTVEDGFLRAQETSLGADDGVGVSLILQALADDTLRHPAFECLFTAQEETGMDGARGMDLSGLRGRMLLNLDGSDESIIVAGSASGARLEMQKPVAMEPAGGAGLEITVSGLLSGHSGEDIHRGRANAIQLMARILERLKSETTFRLASMTGGSKSNAIPDECRAVLILDEQFRPQAQKITAEMAASFKEEYAGAEPNLAVACQPSEAGRCLSEKDSRDLADFLMELPVGILAQADPPEATVISSNNLATVAINEDAIQVCCMCRANYPDMQEKNIKTQAEICQRFGFAMETDNIYGCWPFAERSPLRELYAACAEQVLGKRPKAVLLHAGLESAYFLEQIPDLDVITVGPNDWGLHSTIEKLELSSCTRIWQTLRLLIERLTQA